MTELEEALAWHRAGQGTAPTARSVKYVETIIRHYQSLTESLLRMARLDLSLVNEPVTDLSLAEKFACARTYGNEWFDDLDFAVKARSGLDLAFMRPDAKVTECPIPVSRFTTASDFSIYLFHHA